MFSFSFYHVVLISTLFMWPFISQGQYAFQWQEKASMPFRTSNNAVCSAFSGGEECVYSFMGIDSTKLYTGIHLRTFRYRPSIDTWEELAPVPDTLGKIASAAIAVNGIVYIIGGYHVFQGPPFELSSDRVHRFDPETDSFLEDGAPVPVPIDDHVQCVWRDSLIFLVSGWSDVDFVPDVQIYNPFSDVWTSGTNVPSGIEYEHFGASGVIIGDTIYYHGGAAGGSFSASGRLRKGVIDPEDATQITWSVIGNYTDKKGYRAGAIAVDDFALWIGGSQVTYNYNGISYGGTPVSALDRVLVHDTHGETLEVVNGLIPEVMDIRGLAEMVDQSFYLCGGMESGQEVSDRVYHISFDGVTSLTEYNDNQMLSIWPNPVGLQDHITFSENIVGRVSLDVRTIKGDLILTKDFSNGPQNLLVRDLGLTEAGTYILTFSEGQGPFILLVD